MLPSAGSIIKNKYHAANLQLMTNFSYAKLRSLENMERQSPELTNIGNDFYKEVLKYIRELEKRFEEENNKNPHSKKIALISDELRNTKRIWKSIFERREKKILQAALSAARGGTHIPKFMTDQEKIFYENLLKILNENRKAILGGKEVEDTKKKEESMKDSRRQGDKNSDSETAKAKEEKGNIIVRVLKDVPPFVGSDMKNYSLKKEDVITIPKDTAEILIKRKAAEEIKAEIKIW